jgi:hypothetical protein
MKLERLHKSIYMHDSLGETTFYVQFIKQMPCAVYKILIAYFIREIPTLQLLEHFEHYFKAERNRV